MMLRLPLIFFLFSPYFLIGQGCDCYKQIFESPDSSLLQRSWSYQQRVSNYQELLPLFTSIRTQRDSLFSVLQNSSSELTDLDSLEAFFSCESYYFEGLLFPSSLRFISEISPVQKLMQQAQSLLWREPRLSALLHWGHAICDLPQPFLYYDIKDAALSRAAFLQELVFYDLQPGEHIADVGAGYGYFEQFLLQHSDSLEIQVNELNAEAISSTVSLLEIQNWLLHKQHRFVAITGSAKQANLQAPLDKIFLRNSFHHFYFPDEMLEDLKRALKPEGKIFVVDILRNEITKQPECSEHLPRSLFLGAFRNHGFRLLREQRITGSDFQLFEFGIAQDP